MTISGGRIKQLDIFCRVTGFTGDFLSFIVVELIWFFHGALQFCDISGLGACIPLLSGSLVFIYVDYSS